MSLKEKGFFYYFLSLFKGTLKKNYSDVLTVYSHVHKAIKESIDNYSDYNVSDIPIPKKMFRIWIGEENNLVLLCKKRCVEYCLKWGIQLIEINKLEELRFYGVPEKYLNLYKMGKIKIQHLSDFSRFHIIKENGGIYVDATVYLDMDFDFFNHLGDREFESIASVERLKRVHGQYGPILFQDSMFIARKNCSLIKAICFFENEIIKAIKHIPTYLFNELTILLIQENTNFKEALLNLKRLNSSSREALQMLYSTKQLDIISKTKFFIPQKLNWRY